MKTSIHYTWESTDPSLAFVGEAINRLVSFIHYSTEAKSFQKGDDGAGLKAFHHVTGGGDFAEADVRELVGLLNALASRAKVRYTGTDLEDAPWRDAVLQSAENAIKAADELLRLFYERVPNLKPIAEAIKP